MATRQQDDGPFLISITPPGYTGDPLAVDNDTVVYFIGEVTGTVWTVQSFRYRTRAQAIAAFKPLRKKFLAAGGNRHVLAAQPRVRGDGSLDACFAHLVSPVGEASPAIEDPALVPPGEVPLTVLNHVVQEVDLISVGD